MAKAVKKTKIDLMVEALVKRKETLGTEVSLNRKPVLEALAVIDRSNLVASQNNFIDTLKASLEKDIADAAIGKAEIESAIAKLKN